MKTNLQKVLSMISLQRKGMALVIVLTFSMVLMVLGSSYISSFSSYKQNNPKHLSKIQADFFAQGISKLALLKFKKFPADFYHAYLYDIASKKNPTVVPKLTSPTPLEVFHKEKSNALLQDNSGMKTGVPVIYYDTKFSLTATKNYSCDALLISVTVQMKDSNPQVYETLVEASRSRIL
ncbi:MAG: hypothetical protein HQM10_08680 [Candidatus Riflebacteria bacterium]|nr:hypothetical protein [Candidatus Riflebacteria bacterium]